MLLPLTWVRKLWLERAWRDYPLYDPPHKVEERLLSREKATENFDYFMSVRQQRAAYFRDWLLRNFGVAVTPDEKGMRALNRWANKYAGLLLVLQPTGHPTDCYFTYDPPWTGKNAGHNVLFDMGITLGESVLSNCPKLRWDFDPISAILPRSARQSKRAAGSSFQRPMLTGFDDPASGSTPLHDIYLDACQIMRNITTFKGINSFYSRPRGMRRNVREQLVGNFQAVLSFYPSGDPYNLRNQVGPEDYLKFIDAEAGDEDNNDE